MLQVGTLTTSVEGKGKLNGQPLWWSYSKRRKDDIQVFQKKIKIRAFYTKDIFPCLLTPSLTHHCNQMLLVMLQLPNPCACLWNISIWLMLYIATETAPIIIPSRLPISDELLTTYFALYFSHVRMLRWYMTFLPVVIQLELQKGF